MSFKDDILAVLEVAALPFKLLYLRAGMIRNAGGSIGDSIYNYFTGETGSWHTVRPVADGTLPPDVDGWAKKLKEATKNINDKNPLSDSPSVKFKDNKPIPKGDSPKYDLPGLPTITFPKIPISQPQTERDRVIPFEQKNSLADMEWGRLISYPKIAGGLAMFEMQECVSPSAMENHAKESKAGCLAWLAVNNGDVKRENWFPTFDIYDQSALIIPSNLYNLSGDLTWVFGTQSIHDIYANMAALSFNGGLDDYTLRGVAYAGGISIYPHTDFLGWDLASYKEDKNGLELNGILSKIFRNFTGEKDNNNIEFILENINHGSVAKAVGANNTKPSIVPESLINYTDHDLQCIRYQQIQALKRELKESKDDKHKVLIKQEIKRLETEPIKRYREIHNLDDLVKWSTLAIHELIGAFPLKFRWEAGDILQIGKAPQTAREEHDLIVANWESETVKTTRNHSLASAIRELIVASQWNHGAMDLLMQSVNANLIETGLTKQLAIKDHAISMLLLEWFGIGTEQTKQEVPFTFDPTKSHSLREFLTPSQLKIVTEKLDIKKEPVSVSTLFDQLAEAAQIIKAVHTVGIHDKRAWKDRIKGQAGDMPREFEQGDSVTYTNSEGKEAKRPRDDFDDFCESVEIGFVREATAKPWGRPYENRPRITDISLNKVEQ